MSRPSGFDATTTSSVANTAVVASTPSTVPSSLSSSTIMRASTTAAAAPIASEANVTASIWWKRERVRVLTHRSPNPAATVAAINSATETGGRNRVVGGGREPGAHGEHAHGSNR